MISRKVYEEKISDFSLGAKVKKLSLSLSLNDLNAVSKVVFNISAYDAHDQYELIFNHVLST